METKKQSPLATNITNSWNRLVSLLQNPFVNLVVGVLITAFFFYLVERKEIDTKYAVDNTELIAAQTLDAPELELYWDKEKITDISSVKIAFWNSGKQFLSMENVSKTNPIRIIVPKGVRILFAEVIETSRPTLRFSTIYNQENILSEGITITILDDEAMEHMDGGVVKILFTGTPESDFYITGRILGNANGFKKSRWENSSSWELILTPMVFLLQGMVLFNSTKKALRKRTIDKIMFVVSILMIIASILVIVYSYMEGFFTFPSWIH